MTIPENKILLQLQRIPIAWLTIVSIIGMFSLGFTAGFAMQGFFELPKQMKENTAAIYQTQMFVQDTLPHQFQVVREEIVTEITKLQTTFLMHLCDQRAAEFGGSFSSCMTFSRREMFDSTQ